MSIKPADSIEAILQCPFCNEPDFDKLGLKLHLQLFCEEYKKLEGK